MVDGSKAANGRWIDNRMDRHHLESRCSLPPFLYRVHELLRGANGTPPVAYAKRDG
jgi:hypothetical protein